MKILGLDIGDRWTGIAISDAIGLLARPLKTVAARDLEDELTKLLVAESISTVVVGYPKTLRGTESDQTRKVKAHAAELKIAFPDVTWVLWDERLTSQQASKIKKINTKEDKFNSHAVAASILLSSYLDSKRFDF